MIDDIQKHNYQNDFIGSAFRESVFVKVNNSERIDVCMQYPILNMENAEIECLVREEVYQRLMIAADMLPPGFKLRIWDAWRPFALQKEIYERYSSKIIDSFSLEECTENEKNRMISKFVSLPIRDKHNPPVHTTGGAVDLTILDNFGLELEMGTNFDEFTKRTYTGFFDNGENELVRNNRRFLYDIMSNAGFTNLPSEWWHYDYGDKLWALTKNDLTIYRGVFEKEEMVIVHE